MAHFKRIFRHLFSTHWQLQRIFPQRTRDAIEHEINLSDAQHKGKIRFAVECALSGAPLFLGQSVRERAIDVFSHLRLWDTENRDGVLIYLLLADRSVEIVADRGVHAKTGSAAWEKICHAMELAFGDGQYESGVIDGIRAVNHILRRHFPITDKAGDELPEHIFML